MGMDQENITEKSTIFASNPYPNTPMPTIFTQIIQRKLPAHIVAEDPHHLAFLDIYPALPAHTLVIPKKETDYLFDLPDQDISALMHFTKKVARALQKACPCKRIALLVQGLEVPHAHIHLLPIQKEDDLKLHLPRKKASDHVLTSIATQIQKAF